MTNIFKYKKNAFLVGVLMTFFIGTAGGSDALRFDVDEDEAILTQCLNGEHGSPDESGQYKIGMRRYVCFDVTAKLNDVYTSLLPLGTEAPLGQRVFHERTYEVAATEEVGPSVLAGLQTEGAKLFVRSSPLAFDPEYWALYELLVPVVPELPVFEAEDRTFELEGGESIKLSDLPSLYDEVGDGVVTQHFFAVYYRELKG